MTARRGEQNQRKNTDKRFHGRVFFFYFTDENKTISPIGQIYIPQSAKPAFATRQEREQSRSREKGQGAKRGKRKEKNLMEMFWNTDKKRTFAVRLLPQKQPDVATATALWPGLRWKARQ